VASPMSFALGTAASTFASAGVAVSAVLVAADMFAAGVLGRVMIFVPDMTLTTFL